MNNFGLVSIITPSFNCSAYIADTIESIQNQTYPNWELLITDDCSTDGCTDIIKKYSASDSRIKLFVMPQNSGAGLARNNSITHAQGRYIAFCDSDDKWYPKKLERQLKFMNDCGCGLSYTSYDTCNEDGKINGFVQCLKKITYAKILRDNGIGCLTAIYDADKIGIHLMPSIRKRQDWCLWIKIIKEIKVARGLQEPLALYRVRSGSISSNKIEMLKWNYNVYRTIIGFSAITSTLLLGTYFMPYYFYKKIKQKIDYNNRSRLYNSK